MDNMEMFKEIVSDVVTTVGGREAWVEMDAAGHLTVRCTGCGLDEFAFAMAPALARLVEHASECRT